MTSLYEFLNLRSVSVSLFAGYIAYYLFRVVQKPVVACSRHMKQFLDKNCLILNERYWPTAWCIEPVTQTILSRMIGSSIHIPYEREEFCLSDGGVVMLDWVFNEKSPIPSNIRPTVIILPGLVGSSKEGYVRCLAHESTLLGFRTVVFNNRGRGGATLKTARTYCAANTDDLLAVVQLVKKRYHNSKVFAVGVSLGGIILVNFLARMKNNCELSAAMAISAPWDMFESSHSLELPVNAFVFNKMLVKQLKDSVVQYEHLFGDKCDFKKVMSCNTIREFDETFTSPLFGYDSCKSYYRDACIHDKVKQVQVPLLCLNAADDPFSPESSIPVKEASQSDKVAVVVTPRGGHIAFMDGVFGLKGRKYKARVFSQFFNAMFLHSDQLTSPDS